MLNSYVYPAWKAQHETMEAASELDVDLGDENDELDSDDMLTQSKALEELQPRTDEGQSDTLGETLLSWEAAQQQLEEDVQHRKRTSRPSSRSGLSGPR